MFVWLLESGTQAAATCPNNPLELINYFRPYRFLFDITCLARGENDLRPSLKDFWLREAKFISLILTLID